MLNWLVSFCGRLTCLWLGGVRNPLVALGKSCVKAKASWCPSWLDARQHARELILVYCFVLEFL